MQSVIMRLMEFRDTALVALILMACAVAVWKVSCVSILSPISILTDAVARVINKRWNKLNTMVDGKSPILWQNSLDAALAYTEIVRTRAFSREQDERLARIAESHRSIMSAFEYRDQDDLEQLFDWISYNLPYLLTIILVPIAIALLVTNSFEAFFWLFLLIDLILVLRGFLQNKSGASGKLSPEFVSEDTSAWVKRLWGKSAANYSHERQTILSLMSASSGSGSDGTPNDPDLIHINRGQAVPLPPGVTEIALGVDDETIGEMRSYLNTVRKQHLWFTSLSFTGFLSVIGVTIYGITFRGLEATPQIIGGGGIAAVLGTFCFHTLQNLRTSQIALALFTSYVSELRHDLSAAALERSQELQSQKRGQAWQQFRRGINSLWTLEQSNASKSLFTSYLNKDTGTGEAK